MDNDAHAAPRPVAFDPATRDLGVLVGFDGSKQSFLALHYGALAAQRSGRVLTVVSAFHVPARIYTTLIAVPEKSEAEVAVDAAKTVLAEAREYLKDYSGKVIYRTERGDAAGVLVDLSALAELAVVGARGRGGFLGRVLGSVSSALPAHAHCPTVVVPRQYKVNEPESQAEGAGRFIAGRDRRPVVVGIDASGQSRVAMLQAALSAQNRGVTLHLLMALPSLEAWLEWYPELDSPDESVTERRKTQLEKTLETELALVKRHFPALEVTASVKPGDPIAQLVKQTREAQLTVIGTRGRSGFTGALMGSVSRGVLLRAEGPVMVVPDLKDERLEDHPEPSR
ncbi:universal stress protein [Nesterenkonia sp. LB17]|uniref:universal stress protein n=1 Tax=unclassified Nesterenkonia TaxID=2629769 RepID=UPI001F4CAF71|nr:MULTISPECIES: universal stress protein [unclassified Nesterenkonia]MCH8559123.1 universal stress protein [Nesterenkonia sp. DZ6]MCH8563037.1 universal stress protein [Nesterenkonia sp. YGD6]MCH8565147.1 universal stress protein [Nesterenkonia sp. LB17]MCH8571458.1 universal stress protein [Nesterenkonia sp. AY15]